MARVKGITESLVGAATPGSTARPCTSSRLMRMEAWGCKAGSMLIWHWNLWHKARSNHTDQPRYMYKVFLHPQGRQRLNWDTRDLDDPEIDRILIRPQPWFGGESRVEALKRIELWRYLTGDRTKRVDWQPLDQYPNDAIYDEIG